MSAAKNLKVLVAPCAMIFLAGYSTPAHSQGTAQIQTLADCPAGYVLAVQDTASPQPYARSPDPPPTSQEQANQEATAAAQRQGAAPRAFVTGCVPASPQQNK